jgi:hypothetical protein
MFMSSQLISNGTKQDLEFEWLLCLASTLQCCRRVQVRATRPIPNVTKDYSNFERLFFLTGELQASQH